MRNLRFGTSNNFVIEIASEEIERQLITIAKKPLRYSTQFLIEQNTDIDLTNVYEHFKGFTSENGNDSRPRAKNYCFFIKKMEKNGSNPKNARITNNQLIEIQDLRRSRNFLNNLKKNLSKNTSAKKDKPELKKIKEDSTNSTINYAKFNRLDEVLIQGGNELNKRLNVSLNFFIEGENDSTLFGKTF